MAKCCLPCVILLFLFSIFSVDNVSMKVEGKTCTVAWQGCERYGGRGSCFKPPIASFVECLCEYPC
ncbi:hypothetical protein MKX01_009830 [Papaver californicum]|nr:hypothetical protein MKX01_009830 [Papaver californicum]